MFKAILQKFVGIIEIYRNFITFYFTIVQNSRLHLVSLMLTCTKTLILNS
jgi:hypothetical protein